MRPCRVRLACIVAIAGLVAVGCSAATKIGEAEERSAGDLVDPTSVEQPTTQPPAPLPTVSAPAPSPTVPPVSEPTSPPVDQARPSDIDPSLLQGLSLDGRYGFAAVSPWHEPRACDAEPQEALVRIDIDDWPASFTAGLVEPGDVRQMAFSTDGRAAVLFSCGGEGDPHLTGWGDVWLRVVEFDDRGYVANKGPRFDLASESTPEAPFVAGWKDEQSIQLEFFVLDDPAVEDSGGFEEQVISADSGEVLSVSFSPFSDVSSRFRSKGVSTPDGRFTYTEIDDPNGALGCEGFGVAVTIEVDDGSRRRVAFADKSQVFSAVLNMQFGPSDLVLWTSGCEGYISAYVGRIANDGLIVDAHEIETWLLEGDERYVDYQHYRLASDGRLVAIGGIYEDGSAEPALLRYDLATDPQFVVTAQPPLSIDLDSPLAATMSGEGSWYLGESRAADPGCGATTIYGDTAGGLVRAFSTGFELDTVVAFDASATRFVDFGDEYSYTTRAIVLSTECPDQYEGRRLWFGIEPERVRYGLWAEQADAPEVADVLAVREVPNDDGYSWDAVAEVVMLDGSVAEIELAGFPFEPE